MKVDLPSFCLAAATLDIGRVGAMFTIWNSMFGAKQAPDPPAIENRLPEIPYLEYEQLNINRHEIRMLTLMPKRADGRIHCRIDKISLINPGDYVALSYC
jgi:hypothetical protein